MAFSTILSKYGKCCDCVAEGDTQDKEIIAGRCKYKHYKLFQAKKAATKQRIIYNVRKLGAQSQFHPEFKTLKKVSDKLKAELKIYNVLKDTFLKDHPKCEAKLVGCKNVAKEIHHKKGRGINLNNVDTFLAVCRHCHIFIENHPNEAKELGFSENRLTKKKTQSV